jgi:hypothetical protein
MAGYQFHLGTSRLTVQWNSENLLDEDFSESNGNYTRLRIRSGIPRSFFGRYGRNFERGACKEMSRSTEDSNG